MIVNAGKGHANLSREYSEVPEEMNRVAVQLGCSRLCETNLETLCGQLPLIVKNLEMIVRSCGRYIWRNKSI